MPRSRGYDEACRLTPQARDDIIDGALYIAGDNPAAAERFLTAVERTFETLADNPHIGATRAFANPRLQGIRMLPVAGFRNHLVFYRPAGTVVEIIRVLHAARNVKRLFEQL